MDPEQVRDLMNACFEQLVPIVVRYGGTVSAFLGDAVVALFGAPIAHENDAERAVRAALEMMDAFESFNAAHGTDLGIHFGINTGLVVAGQLGTADYHTYSVMGDTANLASRLEDLSERGQILVGPDTYRLTSRVFDYQPVGLVRIRGRAEPVSVYRVLQGREATDPTHDLKAPGLESPLVGREAEIRALASCIERLTAGKGGVVSITGDAGVGKSRLVAEMRSQARASGLAWLEGRSLPYSQAISYWPFREIVRRDAGIAEGDGEAASWGKLVRRVATLFPEQAAEVLPYLATLLSVEVRGELTDRVRYLDAEGLRRQVFRTARRFFEQAALRRPLVLVFEDWQWADESSAVLLDHLLPLVQSVPLLVCVVSRPSPQSPTARLRELAAREHAERYTDLVLAPLSPAESAQLVRNLLRIDDLSPRAYRAILGRAEGNPFFVEEVLRSLIGVGAVVRDRVTGSWRATPDVERVAVPDTIQGIIVARIDRLAAEVKDVLKIAAVVGRSFHYRVLQAVAEAGPQLDQHLAELQQVELIREKSGVSEREYVFKHALVQEAVYESVLLRRRQELHRRVAEGVERLFADRLEEFCGLLAYHYARAEEWARAQDYLFRAGDQAGRMAADAEALAHYQQAIAAYARTFGDRWDPTRRAALERKMGEALLRRGDHQQATECLQRALACFGAHLPTSRQTVRLELLRQALQQAGHRLLPGVFLRGVAKQAGPELVEQVGIYTTLLWMDYYVDQERFLLDTFTALNLAERGGFGAGVVSGCFGLGVICDAIGLLGVAGHYHRRAVAAAEPSQHPADLGIAHFGLGLHLVVYLGQYDATALAHLQRAAAAYWHAGRLREWGTVVPALHVLALWKGDLAASLKLCRDLVRVGEDGSDAQVLAWGLHGLGRTRRRLGLLAEAVSSLQGAIDLYRAIPDYGGQADAGGELGLCLLRQGEIDRALAVLGEAHRLVASRGLKGHQTVTQQIGLATSYLAAAERAGRGERAEWLRQAAAACQAALRQGNVYCGLPQTTRLWGTYEWLRGRPAAARRWWERSLGVADALGARYDLGLTCLEMGRRMGDLPRLARAEAVLAAVGAELDLAEAQAASRALGAPPAA